MHTASGEYALLNKKIVINRGLGSASQIQKMVDSALKELGMIAGMLVCLQDTPAAHCQQQGKVR